MGLFGFFKKRGEATGELTARVDALANQLQDSDWHVRLEACKALMELGPAAQAAAPRLQDLIDDDNGDVCLAAAAALSAIERGL